MALTACNSTPDGVIPDDEMAELMADIHTAESVVDTERRVFATDSMRRLLKQSVIARYGYTMADFDSSLSYYGRNIDLYAKLYEDVITILDERIAEAESRSATDIAGGRQGSTSDLDFSVDGDSVDVWALPAPCSSPKPHRSGLCLSACRLTAIGSAATYIPSAAR